MVPALIECIAVNTNINQIITQTNVKLQCDRYTKEGMYDAESQSGRLGEVLLKN